MANISTKAQKKQGVTGGGAHLYVIWALFGIPEVYGKSRRSVLILQASNKETGCSMTLRDVIGKGSIRLLAAR